MRHRNLCLFTFCFAALATATPPPVQSSSKLTAGQQAVAKTILSLDEKWSAAAHGHNLAATLSYYSDDAVVLAPNSPIATTKKEIRDVWAAMTEETASVSWKATKVDVAKSLEMAYSYGTYNLTMKDGTGKTITDKGKWVEIWKKQKDGKWKCVVDTFNTDLPAN